MFRKAISYIRDRYALAQARREIESHKKDEEKLDAIFDKLQTHAEGRALLSLLDAQNIGLFFMHKEDQKKSDCVGRYNHDMRTIEIGRGLSMHTMTKTLVHEMRHAWQYHQRDILFGEDISDRMTDTENFMMMRIMEGDAHAYTEKLLAELDGKAPPPEKIKKDFDRFQTSWTCLFSYDFPKMEKMEKGSLSKMFNKSAYRHMPDITRLMVPALDTTAASYMAANKNEAIDALHATIATGKLRKRWQTNLLRKNTP